VLAGGAIRQDRSGHFLVLIHAWRANHPLKYLGFNGTGHQVRDCLHARDLLPLIALQLAETSDKEGAPHRERRGGITQSASCAN